MIFIEINQNFGVGSKFLYMFIITVLVVWISLVIYSLKKYGIKKTTRYFLPMIIVGLIVESAGVANGRYSYPGYILYLSFIGGGVPLILTLGWSANLFLFLNMGRNVVSKLYKKQNILQMIFISILGGLFAVCLDSLEDPIAHHNNWWVWSGSIMGTNFYGVPLSNFIGWFVFIFYMSLATLLIERSSYSENRKLMISLFSLSIVGFAMFATHALLLGFFQLIGFA